MFGSCITFRFRLCYFNILAVWGGWWRRLIFLSTFFFFARLGSLLISYVYCIWCLVCMHEHLLVWIYDFHIYTQFTLPIKSSRLDWRTFKRMFLTLESHFVLAFGTWWICELLSFGFHFQQLFSLVFIIEIDCRNESANIRELCNLM